MSINIVLLEPEIPQNVFRIVQQWMHIFYIQTVSESIKNFPGLPSGLLETHTGLQ